ncbi:CLUMA_CG018428, isoform A [Clunio marinus]|uniref:CLUMA_CG018428, isoform A n=1 Tax=Clunio marinus TaxID=568069 RepID=A0A1J1IY67_9DIPT|nr:CLUMA_CG018428, isoform A [Clunio marinus]
MPFLHLGRFHDLLSTVKRCFEVFGSFAVSKKIASDNLTKEFFIIMNRFQYTKAVVSSDKTLLHHKLCFD